MNNKDLINRLLEESVTIKLDNVDVYECLLLGGKEGKQVKLNCTFTLDFTNAFGNKKTTYKKTVADIVEELDDLTDDELMAIYYTIKGIKAN